MKKDDKEKIFLSEAESSKLKTVESYIHENKKRVNNPKAGLAGHDNDSDSLTSYSFDPHFSPALDWAGKAEKDSLTVPLTSIYTHEVIFPQKIFYALRKHTQEQQMSLFPDASPLERIEEHRRAIETYQHTEKWKNRLIAGDSLVIMNSLLQKESMAGQVQMIYFDPPYGIKYGSNFQPFVDKRDVKDRSDEDLTREPEVIQAFRDTWELEIHSYLTYLRDRLKLARELLADSGSVFIQISDENVHHVREICDEIFGPENFVSLITFKKTSPLGSKGLAGVCDYLIWYAKEKKDNMKYHDLYEEKDAGKGTLYTWLELEDGTRRPMTAEEKHSSKNYPKGAKPFSTSDLASTGYTPTCMYDFEFEGRIYKCGKRSWKTNLDGMKRLIQAKRVIASGRTPRYIRYYDDLPMQVLNNLWDDTGGASDMIYVVQTSTKVIQRCMLMTTDPDDLVLDITCGSGTTAYVAEQWGRRWITCDTSRIAIALARQRLMTASFDFYKFADEEKKISGGFVYKTVPHVTLKSIANDEPPAEEKLYDQPEIDKKKIRVSGPFTVEALPAPVVFSVDEAMNFEEDFNEGPKQSNYREQLLATGILGKNNERINFSRVESLQETRYLNAEAEIAETGQRALICFAGDTVLMDARRIERALKESENQRPKPEFLIFAAFQFDSESQKVINETNWPDMKLLQVNMNTDLMTEDLKRKRSTDQSFWLVGQPDVELVKTRENFYKVRVLGYDYFDINTNKITSGDSKSIAMWLLDTNYDGMNLQPSQIFFPSGGCKLSKTLRAEIDEEKLENFTGNESLEFKAEAGQKIAVKIIDTRGIESMRVLNS